ncbi:hypothetical protein [Bacteroides helcogenes]|nr:hypothetical protein [Bacteroides helcogenes]MDY5239099.1 hypothetical protein [Bacteroides helcogenes]
MIRDTFFSMPRFVSLCRKEMVESWKANVLRMVLIYGILAIVFVWNAYFTYDNCAASNSWGEAGEDPVWFFDSLFFLWAIVIMGCLSASFQMERMKTKTNRTATLMLPATMFEKFISHWLIFTFGFLIVFLIAFKLADWTRVLFFMIKYPDMDAIAPVPIFSYLIDTSAEHWVMFESCGKLALGVSFYFLLHSCFTLGSSIWPKNAFLKTFVAGVIIVIVYLMIGAGLAKIFFPEHYMGPGYFSEDLGYLWGTILFSFGALFNWVLAYFRFKESEIINRW